MKSLAVLIREIGQMRSLWLGLFPPNVMEYHGICDFFLENYMSEKRANAVNLQNISTHKRAFRIDVCTMPLRVHVYVQSYLQSKVGLRHRGEWIKARSARRVSFVRGEIGFCQLRKYFDTHFPFHLSPGFSWRKQLHFLYWHFLSTPI